MAEESRAIYACTWLPAIRRQPNLFLRWSGGMTDEAESKIAFCGRPSWLLHLQPKKQRTCCNWLLESLDNAQIPIGGAVDELQRCLICIAVVSCNRLLDAIELYDDNALPDSAFISCRRFTAHQQTSPGLRQGGPRKLSILFQSIEV
jgi:hypothetical protein